MAGSANPNCMKKCKPPIKDNKCFCWHFLVLSLFVVNCCFAQVAAEVVHTETKLPFEA